MTTPGRSGPGSSERGRGGPDADVDPEAEVEPAAPGVADGSPVATAPARAARLSRELRALMESWASDPAPWPDGRFEALALRAFRIQFEGNAPYRRWCEARGATPARVRSWRDVPAVPTAAFRAVPLVVGDPASAPLVFETSGTTGEPGGRGRHLVPDPALYRASLEAAFRRWVMQGDDRLRLLTLLPRFTPGGASSLGWMGAAVEERFGRGEPARIARERSGGFDWAAASEAAREAERAGEPLCVLATTLALDEWLCRLSAGGTAFRLPPGSRVMDTGGTKGRAGLDRDRVVAEVERRLGVERGRILNELGMTELLSQRYAALAPSPSGGPFPAAGLHYGPPWLRTRALDPVSLEEREEGEVGLLAHYDLANAWSVCAVLTEDVGRVVGGAVEHLGRAPGAPPRGCSLATAELLAAQADG